LDYRGGTDLDKYPDKVSHMIKMEPSLKDQESRIIEVLRKHKGKMP
jgi:hypothetical protein